MKRAVRFAALLAAALAIMPAYAVADPSAEAPPPMPVPARSSALILTATSGLRASLVSPADKAAAAESSVIFDVRTGPGGGVQLFVDGQAVPESRIGKKAVDQKTGDTDWFFYGVALRAGPNDIEMVPLGAGKLRGAPVHAVVYGPGEPAAMNVGIDRQVYANGRDQATIQTLLLDRWQNPVAQHGKVRATIVSGFATFAPSNVAPPVLSAQNVNSAILQDKNAAQIASQDRTVEIGPNGIARFPIVSGLQAGEVVVHIVAENGVEQTFRFFVKADARRPLVVGILTGGIGSVPGLPGLATTVTDGADSRMARAAFFAKGAVGKDTLVTAAYETANRLNDGSSALGPYVANPLDRPYETYGDYSSRDSNALSNARLFLRVDHDRSSAMYGNYTIDTGPLGGLTAGSYHADLSGIRVILGTKSTTATGFTASNPYGFARVEFNPLGLGTAPLLLHTDIVVGTEQVLLVVRDRRTGAVLSNTQLTANVDYLIDDSSGLIRFINVPLPYDQNFNPQTIVVTYQYQGPNITSSTTGFKLDQRFGSAVRLNVGYANDSTGVGNYTIANEDLRATLTGGELVISHAQSGGLASNVSVLNGQQTAQNGGAVLVDYHQKFGATALSARYDNTGQGFSNPFGGLGSPGLWEYSVTAARNLGHGGAIDASAEAERVSLSGQGSAGSRTAVHYSKNVTKNLILRVGLQHVTQSESSSGTVTPSVVTSPAPNAAAAAADSPATSSVQLDTGLAWKPTSRFDLLFDRLSPLTGASGSLYPGETLLEAGYSMGKAGRAFIRQQWTDTPNSSLYSNALGTTPVSSSSGTVTQPTNAIGQFAATTGTTSSTEIGFSRTLGVATTYESGLIIDNGQNVHDMSWGNQVDERFTFGKGLTGDATVQVANPLSGTTEQGGFAVYGLTLGYTNANHLKAGVQVQQRNGSGNGSTLSFGATGPLNPNWNILGTSTISDTPGFSTHDTRLGLSWRPALNDKGITLFEYDDYSGTLTSGTSQANVAAIEQVYRPLANWEFSGRFAYKIDGGGGYYAAHTMFYGARITKKLTGKLDRFDIGAEVSGLSAPGIGSTSTSAFAAELGLRALANTRLAAGYNFSGSADPSLTGAPTRRGVYFTATSTVDSFFGWGKPH
jgi:hypothetical protein